MLPRLPGAQPQKHLATPVTGAQPVPRGRAIPATGGSPLHVTMDGKRLVRSST